MTRHTYSSRCSRWQQLCETPFSRAVRVRSFARPRQAFRSLTSNLFQRPTVLVDPADVGIRVPETHGSPALNRTSMLGVRLSAVHNSIWSDVSQEDGVVHDSVGGLCKKVQDCSNIRSIPTSALCSYIKIVLISAFTCYIATATGLCSSSLFPHDRGAF